ncbi:glucose-1-phosphate cytidylyltransferase [Bowmanella denitrificans]|uniref:Glucose-1-phosphate cytidylyltransferase n=1 Tax=Bowmanella denitrificans TaxID=366582 RepID=A0ABN0XKP6_9ALTE
MKAVILAGGLGTRISEESHLKPKPMIEIGNKPILWHIMKIYSSYGINDFIICCGYKGYVIKEYFANYFLHTSDVTFDLGQNSMQVHSNHAEPWRVTLVDTGETTQTGGRIKRVAQYLDDTFCLTYGDGVADVDLNKLIDFHHSNAGLATVTAVMPPARWGDLTLSGDNRIEMFNEKPVNDGRWINGGFFVLSKKVLDFIQDDSSVWEREPMEALAAGKKIFAYQHKGFWQAMDTLREKNLLEELWASGKAPWKLWD